MSRLKAAAAVAVLLGAVGCGHMEDPVAASQASPSYSGPAWEAYRTGREFGRDKQGAQIPNSVARTSDGTLKDAIEADRDNAEWWCRRNLPAPMKADHEAHRDALLAGCVGGVLPMMDAPELWGQDTP
ncbi:hypothetical protein RPQ02_39650 [Streptomyces sp. AM2-3-1]|uniref:hypothetical protein n=1 Tax=Streptomyces sp. AM2-3-1 TaxID=3075824 RepID=UPI0028C47A1A|nr:hypothetical protein [Streptomyces sp. AM2-3-1]WNO69454.1 hypothetical protein RPQ02_39650 [Streptomyces sp. AM2-3-1]